MIALVYGVVAAAASRRRPHWTKVLFALVGTGSKIILDYVIRHLDAFSAGLKDRLKGLTFAETSLARSPASTGAPSHLK
jgi:hypothetical protein